MNLKARLQMFKDKTLDPSRVKARQQNGDFTAPLGAATNARLVFARGASRVTLSANTGLLSLFEAHFRGRVPDVQVQEGKVTICYPYLPLLDWLTYWWWKPAAKVTLNDSIVWHFLFRGGVSRLTAELERMKLHSVKFDGGASRVNMRLPRPTNTVSIRIAGGASNVTIDRPNGVPVRIRVDSGLNKLTFDRQRFGAMGRNLCHETDNYESAASRYDITILGGASNITIGTWKSDVLDKTKEWK